MPKNTDNLQQEEDLINRMKALPRQKAPDRVWSKLTESIRSKNRGTLLPWSIHESLLNLAFTKTELALVTVCLIIALIFSSQQIITGLKYQQLSSHLEDTFYAQNNNDYALNSEEIIGNFLQL